MGPALTKQQQRVLLILKGAGDDGVLGSDFYGAYLPTFSQRIGELNRKGYVIRSVPARYADGATGRRYFLESEPVPLPKPTTIRQVPVPESPEVADHGGTVDFDRLFPLPRHRDAA